MIFDWLPLQFTGLFELVLLFLGQGAHAGLGYLLEDWVDVDHGLAGLFIGAFWPPCAFSPPCGSYTAVHLDSAIFEFEIGEGEHRAAQVRDMRDFAPLGVMDNSSIAPNMSTA